MVPVPIYRYREVGEHSSRRGSSDVNRDGAAGKADVGISNDNAGGKPAHRKTKVS